MLMNVWTAGEDFGTLANELFRGTEASGKGGDLGFAQESSLKNTDPVTRDTVTTLKPGQYSRSSTS